MAYHESGAAGVTGRNHPLAVRMGIIAGVSHNLVIGLIFGSFSVLIGSVEHRLGVTREYSSLAVPLVTIGSSLMAPFVGVLAARYSLRWLMFAGAVCASLGWTVLATTNSYPLFLFAYGALLGPAMCLAGSMLPPTLVARWFRYNKGKALGLVHIPVVIALAPVLINAILATHGAIFAYAVMAAITAAVLLPATLLVRDPPEGTAEEQAADAAGPATAGVAQIALSPRFWGFAVCACTNMTSSVIMGTHIVPMAESWGLSAANGALLASIMSGVGIAGSILWGWVADRLGGGRTLGLVAVVSAVLWLALMSGPGYWTAAALIGLIGMCGTASIPVLGAALSEAFGPASFSRAFGLANLVALPFTVIGVQSASAIFVNTGSYTPMLGAMAAAFLIVAVLPVLAARRRPMVAAAAV